MGPLLIEVGARESLRPCNAFCTWCSTLQRSQDMRPSIGSVVLLYCKPSTRPRTRIGGSGAHGGRGMLLRASACRATALVCATAERYKQHTIGRSLSRRQRLRPRQAPNSEHKAYKGSEAIGHHNTTQHTRTRARAHVSARRSRRRRRRRRRIDADFSEEILGGIRRLNR